MSSLSSSCLPCVKPDVVPVAEYVRRRPGAPCTTVFYTRMPTGNRERLGAPGRRGRIEETAGVGDRTSRGRRGA